MLDVPGLIHTDTETHCAKNLETNFPKIETARHRSQFLHSCICEQFIYSHDRSAYFSVLCLRPAFPFFLIGAISYWEHFYWLIKN